MRDRLLPLVAETLVAGGETATAGCLARCAQGRRTLDLARAMLQEARGRHRAAWQATIGWRSRATSRCMPARAIRAVELRLAAGAIDARQAADRLERLLYAWRGDQHERALRERLAELKARTGAWRAALALLRETEALFPDDKAAIHAELTDMFAALLRERRGGHAGAVGTGVAGGGERRPAACRPGRRSACRRDWPTGCWRSTCRSAPDRCWRN